MHLIQTCYALGNTLPECLKRFQDDRSKPEGVLLKVMIHTLNFPTPYFCEGNVWFKIATRWNPNLCPATGLFRLSLYFRLEHHVIQRCSFGKRYGVGASLVPHAIFFLPYIFSTTDIRGVVGYLVPRLFRTFIAAVPASVLWSI